MSLSEPLRLAKVCEQVLAHTAEWLADHDIACTFVVRRADFVLENASYLQPSLFNEHRERYDLAIANPPYFKLLKDDRRARAAAHIVHGQPNIYAISSRSAAFGARRSGRQPNNVPCAFTT